jgi:agmatinase
VCTSRALARRRFRGESWQDICQTIVSMLPQKVYVSFDIDGLDPTLCPHTGTPVPGGLAFEEACFLVETVVAAGKQIIGCDLSEVAPGDDEWDGNVGARLLYRLCTLMAKSHDRT